jgi:hypothetical protein
MPTLDWLDRQAAFQTAARVPIRVLRPIAVGHVWGDAVRCLPRLRLLRGLKSTNGSIWATASPRNPA